MARVRLRSPSVRRSFVVGALSILAAALSAVPAAAQSCVLTRLDSPVLHAFDPAFDASDELDWQFSVGWRYGRSDRHFVGTDEQEERQREGSEVINSVHLLDLELRYSFDAQNSVSVGVPYLMAVRTGPVRGEDRELLFRETRSNTRGIGDIAVVYHRLLRDPAARPRSNVSFGVGLELPTGENAQTGVSTDLVDGELVTSIETADQSVQPGDGGFGIVLQASGYALLDDAGSLAGYASATYIVAPEGDSGVRTFRGAPEEAVMSIADQYVARLGVQAGPPSWKGWSAGLGGRIEGIPAHDLIGSSDGFRRPGYMLSVEPSMAWLRGSHSVSLALPIAVERNRQRSVPDIRRGRHGDAAFPDYLVLAGYSRRF
jgi:hypothetical protein